MSVLRIQILHVLMLISPNVCSVSLMTCSVGIVYSHPIKESSLIKLSLVMESVSSLFAMVVYVDEFSECYGGHEGFLSC